MTIEPLSDERLAEIRAGLEGVTPGPWVSEIETSEHVDESEDDRQPEVYVCSSDTCCDYTVVATMGRAEAISHDRKSRDASHIARLDPQTVAAILSRLDKAEAGWQPISTAPKDGRKVLIWLEDGEWSRHETARWWSGAWFLDQDAGGENRKVKLWAPLLPPPPSES